MPGPGSDHRHDIQGLRAVAVLLVIAAHAGLTHVAGGFVGVDVFLVLSGFLITGLLLREMDSGRFSIARFYARRARRILPAATVLIVVVLGFIALHRPPDQLGPAKTDAAWTAFFLSNVHFAQIGTDYFAQNQAPSPFQHYWSLAVEEQFYVVWPIVLLLLTRFRRLRVAGTVALLLASLAWSVRGVSHDVTLAYFSTFGRAFELLAGAVLAMLVTRVSAWTSRMRTIAAALGLAGLAFAVLKYDDTTLFPGLAAVVPVTATMLLILAGTATDRPVAISRLLGRQPLRYLGDISYSLYLWHWPVLVLTDWPARVAIPVSLALAMLSYHLIEQPIRLGVRFRPVPAALAIWPACLALVFVTIGSASAWSSSRAQEGRDLSQWWFDRHPELAMPTLTDGSFDPQQVLRRSLKTADAGAPIPAGFDPEFYRHDHSSLPEHCYSQHQTEKADLCRMGDTGSDRVVVLFGDSHANIWVDPLDAIGKREGFTLLPIIKMGCAPFDVPQLNLADQHFTACDHFRIWALRTIARLKPDAVIVGYRGLLKIEHARGDDVASIWTAGVERTLAKLSRSTERLSVISDWTGRHTDPVACASAKGATQLSCVTAPRGAGPRSNRLTQPLVEAARAHWVDVGPLVCVESRCPLFVGDISLFRDNNHLSSTWTTLNATWLRQQLGSSLPDQARSDQARSQ